MVSILRTPQIVLSLVAQWCPFIFVSASLLFTCSANAQDAALQLDKDSYLNPGLDGAHLLLNELGADFSRLRLSNSNYNAQTNARFWDIAGSVGTASDGSSDALNFYNRGFGDVLSLRGNGRIGIGTTNPNHKLDIAGSLNLLKGQNLGSALFVNSRSVIDLNQGVVKWGLEASYNLFDKDVGIGVTIPRQALHVGGTLRSDDLVGLGNRRLVATASGDIATIGGAIGTHRIALSPLEFRSSSNQEDSSFVSTPEVSYSTKQVLFRLPYKFRMTLILPRFNSMRMMSTIRRSSQRGLLVIWEGKVFLVPKSIFNRASDYSADLHLYQVHSLTILHPLTMPITLTS